MIRASLIILLLLLPGAALPLTAQEAASPAEPAEVRVESMTVDIWPEYDDPRVLVIYRGELDGSVETPTPFSLTVPVSAQIHMAGGLGPNGEHIHGRYRTRAVGDSLKEVLYDLEVPTFYMEFYYDPLEGGEERSFSYPLVSSYDVGSLIVSVQEPRRAEGFDVVPATTEVLRDDRGFPYHIIRHGDVAAGTARSVEVRYRKADREPSVTPEAQTPSEGGGWMGVWPEWEWERVRKGLMALAVFVLGFCLYGWYRTTREAGRHAGPGGGAVAPDAGRSAGSGGGNGGGSRSGEADGAVSGAGAVGGAGARPVASPRQSFCTHCGEPLGASDRFCAMCGGPRRGVELHRTTFAG